MAFQLAGMLPLSSLLASPKLLKPHKLPHSAGSGPLSLLLCRYSCRSRLMLAQLLGRVPLSEQP
jgi:hypothetical protein